MSSIAQQVASLSTQDLEAALMSDVGFPDEIIFAIVDELGQRYYELMLAEDFSDEEQDEDFDPYDYSQDEDYYSFREEDFWDEPFTDWS